MGVTVTPSFDQLRNKPTTVAGFGITDMATQTVANATNATNATNVTNVTTAQVLAAEAGASTGAVGTYFCPFGTTGVVVAIGGTTAGSNLTKINSSALVVSAGLSGTWRNMGAREDGASQASIYLRIA